jgi:hypothetical protein
LKGLSLIRCHDQSLRCGGPGDRDEPERFIPQQRPSTVLPSSVRSQWVEQEVETALAKECEGRLHILFPIRLDKTVMQFAGGWPALIRRRKHIGDFKKWKQHDDYQEALERLLHDLKAEGEK